MTPDHSNPTPLTQDQIDRARRMYREAKRPTPRADRVAGVRQMIASGEYDTDERIHPATDRLVEILQTAA